MLNNSNICQAQNDNSILKYADKSEVKKNWTDYDWKYENCKLLWNGNFKS